MDGQARVLRMPSNAALALEVVLEGNDSSMVGGGIVGVRVDSRAPGIGGARCVPSSYYNQTRCVSQLYCVHEPMNLDGTLDVLLLQKLLMLCFHCRSRSCPP